MAFLVVGGVCALIHGAPVSTFDLDVVPERSEENVARLLRALTSLDALIEVKREAGREKDLAALPTLVRTLAERRKQDD